MPHVTHAGAQTLIKYFSEEFVDYPLRTERNPKTAAMTASRTPFSSFHPDSPFSSQNVSNDVGVASLCDALIGETLAEMYTPDPDDDSYKQWFRECEEDRIAHMRSLCWRWDIQKNIFENFVNLVDSGIIDSNGLDGFIEISGRVVKDVKMVMGALTSFEFCAMLDRPPQDLAGDIDWYPAPLQWLATAIIRGTNVRGFSRVQEHLLLKNQLGAFDMEIWNKRWPQGEELVRRENIGVPGSTAGDSKPYTQGSVGFILPMNLGEDHTLADVHAAFDGQYWKYCKFVNRIFD